MKHKSLKSLFQPKLLKLDFGCGPNKKEGFIGVDSIQFDGKVDVVMNVVRDKWPWKDESVEEANASHFYEHLTAQERVHFCNELYRILITGGKCQVIVPHWASCRAYGDPTHVWPPVSEFAFYYMSKDWRKTQAPHTDIEFNKDGFNCNFNVTWGYSLRQDIVNRNQEFQQFAIGNYKEVCQDIIAMFTKL